jgi:copper chaperone CopZ
MKNIILRSFLFAVFISFAGALNAQDTLQVKTSAQCGSCKKLIEHDMKFEKGVESASLDVKSQMLTIVYNPEKTNPEKLKVAVTEIGYDADELPADPKAYDKLKDCCKKGGMD